MRITHADILDKGNFKNQACAGLCYYDNDFFIQPAHAWFKNYYHDNNIYHTYFDHHTALMWMYV